METIEIRLFATLRINKKRIMHLPWHEGITGKDLLKSLNISQKEIAIFLINGRDGTMETPLSSEDYLSLFPPVGGG